MERRQTQSKSNQRHSRTWLWLVVVIIIAVLGIAGYHFSHDVSSQVPGHVYQYSSNKVKKSLYMTFATSGNHVVVTNSKSQALKADESTSQFNTVWAKQNKSNAGSWKYRANGSKLTLAQIRPNNRVSQWQYNGVWATKNKVTSHSFTYQIANAGQGKVRAKVSLNRIDK